MILTCCSAKNLGFVGSGSLWLSLRKEHQPADLQVERELLAVVVAGAEFHRFEFQRHWVFFDILNKPA